MTEPVEPHLSIWRFGGCVACGAPDSWVVVAVPKLSTGEQFPQLGVCEECGHEVDLHDMAPFVVVDAPGEGGVLPRREPWKPV